MARSDISDASATRARLIFTDVCAALVAWVVAYFVATRLVDPGGASGTILGDVVYPQLEALATAMLIWAGRLAHEVAARIAEHGVPAGALRIEITEAVVMSDPVRAQAVLERSPPREFRSRSTTSARGIRRWRDWPGFRSTSSRSTGRSSPT